MPTETVTPAIIAPVDTATLSQDLQKDIALGLKVVSDYKAKGRQGLLDNFPELVADVKQTYQDVSANLPALKAGYKTTEMWVSLAAGVGIVVLATIQHHTLTTTDFGILGSIAGVYTMVRGLTKAS